MTSKTIDKLDFIVGTLLFIPPFIGLYIITENEWGIIMSIVFFIGFIYWPIIVYTAMVLLLKLLFKYNIFSFVERRIYYSILFCVVMTIGFIVIHERSKNTNPYCQYVTNILTVEEINDCSKQ